MQRTMGMLYAGPGRGQVGLDSGGGPLANGLTARRKPPATERENICTSLCIIKTLTSWRSQAREDGQRTRKQQSEGLALSWRRKADAPMHREEQMLSQDTQSNNSPPGPRLPESGRLNRQMAMGAALQVDTPELQRRLSWFP